MRNKSKNVSQSEDQPKATNFTEIIEKREKWFEQVSEDPAEIHPVTEMQLVDLKEEAKKHHDTGFNQYNTSNSKFNKSPDYQWMKTILAKGTASDKIAAYTVMIQDNPVYNLKTIQDLVTMVKVGKKTDCVMVMQTLSELFLSDLLKPDTKLKPFYQRPLSMLDVMSSGNTVSRKNILTHWYFEDQLKETYNLFIQGLTALAHDSVEANKEKAVSVLYNLLSGHPEQEKNLLTNIVNKLGDPSQKVASKTIYCLGQLLFKHPNMKQVVLKEIEKLLFRTNVPPKAQYYGICFLSQYYLSHDDFEVAKNLITVYFAFFKACVKKNEVNSKLMSALLMGVNRAYPYAQLKFEDISEHINTMYRIVHQAAFNVSLHALALLFQVCDIGNAVNDRFYCTLYKKIMDPKINQTAHQAILLSLLFKALSKDTKKQRVNAFVKRLLQVALLSSVPMTCGILYMISQLQKYRILASRTEVDIQNAEMDLNKVNAEQKSESPDIQPIESISKSTPENEDVDEEDKKPVLSKISQYNPYQRNPLYAGGEFCVHEELYLLLGHFHPTVVLFSKNLIEGKKIIYSGDPLKDFTLVRFLDRFVFKNPKKIDENGYKETTGYHFKIGKRKAYLPLGLRSIPITSSSYLKEDKSRIPADELFMHTYLQNRMSKYSNDPKDEDSDDESVASVEFEEMLDKMSGKKTAADDDDFDFMNEIALTIGNKKKKSKKEDSDSGSENEDEIDSNNEYADEDDDDEQDIVEDDGEDFVGDMDDNMTESSDEEFSSDGENEPRKSIKGKKSQAKKRDDLQSLFVSADEFAVMLENNASSKVKSGSSSAMSTEDKASQKQIMWEQRQNRWLSSTNAPGKSNRKNSTPFTKKRKSGPPPSAHIAKKKKKSFKNK